MNWLKLGIPILLGLAAGAVNYMAMNTGTQSRYFVRMATNMKAGQPFTEENVERVELKGDAASLKDLGMTAVPYDIRERVLLKDKVAPLRAMNKGDLVLWRDVVPPPAHMELAEDELAVPVSLEGMHLPPSLVRVGDEVSFVVAMMDKPAKKSGVASVPAPLPEPRLETVGPFRVVSVGPTVHRRAGDETGPGQQGEVRSITIAMRHRNNQIEDAKAQALLRADYDERSSNVKRIIKVVLSPARKRAGSKRVRG